MATNLKEQAARKILRKVRCQGHPYVELRENGKHLIFFCTLCLAPCYGDTVLYDHLKGNLHNTRLSTAKLTLLGPNPWPFNDGVAFFDTSTEDDEDLEIANDNQNRLLNSSVDDNDNNLAIVNFVEAVQSDAPPSSTNDMLDDNSTLLIPHLLIGDDPVDIKIREVGVGKIGARFLEIDNSFIGIRRIWCEWLGNENNSQQDGDVVPGHDFGVVSFSYNYALGRSGLLADVKSLLPSASLSKSEDVRGSGRKRKALLPGHEDVNDSLSNQCVPLVEGSSASNNALPRLTLDNIDNRLLRTKISSRTERKELRRKQRLAAEKMCNICQQKMIAGKDVAAFLNLKTRRIACSSRNGTGVIFNVLILFCYIGFLVIELDHETCDIKTNYNTYSKLGKKVTFMLHLSKQKIYKLCVDIHMQAFHVFHTSCVIHWILLCELYIITNRLVLPEVRQGRKKKVVANGKKSGKRNNIEAASSRIKSVFCPECLGSGIIVDGNRWERCLFNLSEVCILH